MRLATFYAAVIQGMCTQACDGTVHEDLEHVVDLAMMAWPVFREADHVVTRSRS